MRINQNSVIAFAQWSGDRNPIHVDSAAAKKSAFGGTIVHGALSTIEALTEAKRSLPDLGTIESLEIIFRGEVRPEREYRVAVSRAADSVNVQVCDAAHTQLSIAIATARADASPGAQGTADSVSQSKKPAATEPATGEPAAGEPADWVPAALCSDDQSGNGAQPADWSPADFRQGEQLLGVHRFSRPLASLESVLPESASPEPALTSTQAQVLALCSYIVGMKAPGLSSLFTRLKVDYCLSSEATVDALAYRLTFALYDPHFRLLETELEVASLDGQPVAKALIQSYVRFPSALPDMQAYAGGLAAQVPALQRKVALVCGASRGLGAELAAALGAAQCRVYLACRHPDDQTQALADAIRQAGGTATIEAGDVGDAEWCRNASARILQTHGRLDLLILNACAPPNLAHLSATSAGESSAYIAENVALAQTPLIYFLPLVAAGGGTVVAISSSAVDETPAGFGDYIAVKMAMEGSIKTAARENPGIQFLIARPPKLRTSWSDSPLRAMGAIPPASVALRVVQAITQPDPQTNLRIMTSFPYDEPETKSPQLAPDLILVLCASFTLDPIGDGLQLWSKELDVSIEAELAPYAQVLQQLLNPASDLSRNRGGSVVLIRLSDWLRELPEQRRRDAAEVERWLRSTAAEHVQALKTHRQFAHGSTLLLICPSTIDEVLTASMAQNIERSIASALEDVPGLTVVEARSYHATYEVPEESIFDPLREEIAHIPYQSGYYYFLATLIARAHHRRLSAPKKVVVLDCDNTLWSGVVGEVGPEGIVFTDAHRRLHGCLVQLAESGVLLCLCSKNEPDDVSAVFASRTDFALRPEQFVASVINWQPKSDNIRALAERLKLGLDSFIFLDDSPVECAEVRSHCPGVLTVQWPQEPRAASRLLDHLWEFDTYATTAEDRNRTQMYREEFQRQEIHQQAASFQEFIDSLQLHVQVQRLSEDDVERASQLTMRTNQFNFTTIRRTEAELRALMADSHYECRTVRVSDRFGDYGMVGFFIAQADGNVLNVDTFLLSCRVLGRGVEHQMAAELGQIAQARQLPQVHWHLTPTQRNAPAQIFLTQIAGEAMPAGEPAPYECRSDTSALVELRFDAAQASTPRGSEDGNAESMQTKLPGSYTAQSIQSVRQRERQIERSAERLSSYALLSQAVAKNGDQPTPEQTGDIAVTVQELFAQTLRLPITEITRIDRLDAMGCDSLQIVELTVALTKRFPWLPKTLLFEHRSVSEIIAQITSLSSGETPVAARKVSAAPASPQPPASCDIAIVGIGVNCAGGKSPQELWEFLAEGRSAITRVPPQHDSFVGQLSDARPHYAGLLPGVGDFDPEFFGISPREAEFMDPQLRLLLQTAWHALEDAGGQGDGFDPATGIFVGVMYATYGRFANVIASQKASAYRCWEGFSLPNRLSQVLGCCGPSLAVDTACSSSATALHYACHSLRAGDCTTAVVSGVNLIIDPERLVQFGRLGILSLSGHCVPFGAGADGTVLGEGVVSLVLRPLEEARRRSDRIYAVIKGTGLSLGAGSVGFTAPNPNAQAQAARNAIVAADIDPRTVSYIETHGTGTELGDPIEVRGLELAYCDRSLWRSNLQIDPACTIGSIKPNIGHLEAGAGLTGVMKAALQLYHRQLLPSLTSPTPNPQIHFESLPFDVQRSLAQWRPLTALSDGEQVTLPRRAGVNSFGVGGSNVHVILEEASKPIVAATPERERSAHVLTLSATTEAALQLQAAAWQPYLAGCDPDGIADACYSANVGRKHHGVRTAVVIPPLADACDTLERIAQGQAEPGTLASSELRGLDAPPALKTAFLFTGQGAQYPGMLRQLHQESPVFREAFDRCARYLDRLLPQALDSIIFSGSADDREHAIHQTGYTQPALFTIQYALFQLWKSWGIVGDVLMGHSIGEVAAYCVAGGCSLEDALELVAARGRLMQALPAGGSMCSIALDRDSIERGIEDLAAGVSIAAVNGPKQTVISGPRAAVALVAERLEAQHGIKTTQLSVSHAFHSALMEPMLDEFEKVLRKLDLGTPQIPIVSSATGGPIAQAMSSPAYWLQQARQAVLFTDAIESLQRQSVTHYVELGPHPVMLSMGRQCVADPRVQWLPSIRRGQDDWSVILDSLCKLFSAGAEVDWRGFDAPYARRRVAVPGYQFDTRRIWIEELQSGPSLPTPVSAASGSAAADRQGARGYLIEWIESPRAVRQRSEVDQGQSARQRPAALQSEQAETAANGKGEPSRWLVLSAYPATANALAESLAARGIACLPAALTLAPADPQTVTTYGDVLSLPPGNGKPSADLPTEITLASLAELEEFLRRNTFARIIYLDRPQRTVPKGSLADDARSNEAGARGAAGQPAQAIYDRSVASVFDLAQIVSAVTRCHAAAARCLWTITSNAVAAEWDGALNISSAPLWGFARVAALECEAIWGGIIDVDDPAAEVDQLIEELTAPDDDDQIVLRESRRLVPRLKLRSEPTSQRGVGLGAAFDLAGGAILITGGVGGIGMHIAKWLAEQGAKRLLLTSRSGVASGDASATIESLQRRGVDVSVIAADVSTPQGIEACFSRLGHTPLIGVIHAAGIDLRLPITNTSREHVEQVLAAKVRGAWLLHQACEDLDLQMFVCLSSMAAILGSSDRSVYAAANAFLDALAHHRRQAGLPALTLNFGPWSGGGMADAQSLAQLERIGNQGLVPEDTLRLLTDLLRDQDTQVMVADIDWQRFRPVFESRRPKPILGELGREAKTSPGAAARRATASTSTWIEALRGLPDAQRADQLMRLLQDEFAQTLRLSNARGVSPDRSLFQMGLDSITAVEFSIKLQRHTGLQTSSMLVGAPTLRRLADTLLPMLAGALAGSAMAESSAEQQSNGQQSIGNKSAGGKGTSQGSTERQNSCTEDSCTEDASTRRSSTRGSDTGEREALRPSRPQDQPGALGVPACSEVLGADAAMEPAIVAFCREAWPDRRPDLLAARWNWMFLQSAKRLEAAPRVWLFRDADRILGHMGAQFFRLKIGQQERTTGWLVDTMVLESHRDLGIGARLLLQSQEDMPFALSLGQTAQARTILKAMGWKYIAPLQTYVLALNANRVLQDKLPSPVVPAVSTLLRLRGSTRRLLSVHSTGSATIHQIDRFSARHDVLWRDVSTGYGCAAVRDASYLNWKYVDQPGQDYIRLEVRRDDEVIGCVVLLLTEPNDVYQHRRAYIVDLIAAPDTSHLHTALRAAIRHCEELEIDAVVMHVINRPIERALKNFGFLRRTPTRHLMLAGCEPDHPQLLDPAQWLITHGDSDIDRP